MKNNISHDHTTKVAALRLIRVVNALTFCELARMSCRWHREDWGYLNFQSRHAMWLIGGYLYEAFHLVNDLSENFGTTFHFKELMHWAKSVAEYEELLADMNCNPAFTLDYGGETTGQICETVWIDNTRLAEARDGSNPRIPFYDEATKIDVDWLRQQTRQYLELERVHEFVNHGLELYSKMFRMATVKFLDTQILGSHTEDMGVSE